MDVRITAEITERLPDAGREIKRLAVKSDELHAHYKASKAKYDQANSNLMNAIHANYSETEIDAAISPVGAAKTTFKDRRIEPIED